MEQCNEILIRESSTVATAEKHTEQVIHCDNLWIKNDITVSNGVSKESFS